MAGPYPDTDGMTEQEQKSLTHGEFWIPAAEREVYREALELLNGAGIRYVVSGLYAIHNYTGIYRETKDLDLLLEPDLVVPAAEVLAAAGFEVVLKEEHWLAQAFRGAQVDLIFGMANGMGFIDEAWYGNSRPAILAAAPVRVAPPEELIWHRLFIGERHRFDMADVVHLILHRGGELDWDRLLERVGPDWRLLLSQIHFFDFTYPDHRDRIPAGVRRELRRLDAEDGAADEPGAGGARMEGRVPEVLEADAEEAPEGGGPAAEDVTGSRWRCRGTLLSRYSFAIDVNEWGFEDERLERVARRRASDIVAAVRDAEVWDE